MFLSNRLAYTDTNTQAQRQVIVHSGKTQFQIKAIETKLKTKEKQKYKTTKNHN